MHETCCVLWLRCAQAYGVVKSGARQRGSNEPSIYPDSATFDVEFCVIAGTPLYFFFFAIAWLQGVLLQLVVVYVRVWLSGWRVHANISVIALHRGRGNCVPQI
jgi:hypothetical protein